MQTMDNEQLFLNRLQIPQPERKLIERLKEHSLYAYKHSVDTAMVTKRFMEFLNFSKESIVLGTIAALVHDIGLLSVPSEIINKPGAWTTTERNLVSEHTNNAIEFLNNCNELEQLAAISHHKHYSEELDELTQIIAICATYSANKSERPDRTAAPNIIALNAVLSAKNLNPEFVSDFKNMITKSRDLIQLQTPFIKLDPTHYEPHVLHYIALKYHVNETQLYIDNNNNYVVYDKKVLATLDNNGVIENEPHEIELLGDGRLFDKQVEWESQDRDFLDINEYEELLS